MAADKPRPSSSRPVETPEQRKARKQVQEDKANAQKYADSQARLLNTEQNQNHLKRETPFLCNVRFRCDLPEVPGDPKMVVAPLQAKELATFSLTSLERAPVRHLSLQPDLGIPLSYLDMGVYAVPDQPQALAPEDAALVEGGTEGMTLPAHLKAAVKTAPGPSGKTELSWLMRTTYISNDSTERRQQGITEKRAKAERQAQEEAPADTRETQLEAIQASFEAAQLPPVHQTKPSMKALKILPVLPDAERSHHSYVNMVFDNDPTAEHERLAKLSNKQRRRISEMAMMKSYALASTNPDGKGAANRFVAYMVPKEVPQETPAHPSNREDTDASIMEGEYEWVREYLYDVRQDEEKRTYILRETPTYMGYVDLNTRLMVHKRGKRMKSDNREAAQNAEFPRPEKITVTRLYPEGMEPPPKRRQFTQRQASPDSQQDADINTKTIGAAEPVDSIQPESRQGMYAGLGLESSDED
ncbi:hypothetical protein WJX82_011579 [Trebouxia sp. C0006]